MNTLKTQHEQLTAAGPVAIWIVYILFSCFL